MSPKKPITALKRLPRTRRAKNPPGFRVTERDVEIIRSVLSFRFLYTKQLHWLFPDASEQNLNIRLRLLYHHGYLERVPLPESRANEQLVYALTEKGALLLAESDGVSREDIFWRRYMNIVSPSHIRHLLAINDVLVSYQLALTKAFHEGHIVEYKVVRGEPRKHKLPVSFRDKDGRRVEAAIVPDAFLAIKFDAHNYGVFFVEVDRATMSTGRWQEKIQVYRDYNRSEHLKRTFKAEWCIVLTVAPSDKRIISLAEKTVALGGRRGFWFTKPESINPDTAGGRIWVRASDLFDTRNEQLVKLRDLDKAPHVGLGDALL